MTATKYQQVLDRVTRVRGVRGAMLVAGEDGLIVAESLMEGVRGNAVAALAASLAQRFRQASEASGAGVPDFLHLQGDADLNVGLVRLEMLRAAEVLE